LRGIAILLVLLGHNFLYLPFTNTGWIGVDLFFVLSGFLITDILLRSREEPRYLQNFYAKRVLRIFPIYYFSLFLFLILFPYFSINTPEYNFNISHQGWYWSYLQNWFYVLYPNQSSDAMAPFWSLAIEEQFYILWPLLLLFIKNRKRLLLILLTLFLVINATRIALLLLESKWATDTTFTVTRCDGILVGSMIALSKNVIKWKTVFITGFVIFLFFNLLGLFLWMTLEKNILYFSYGGYPLLTLGFGYVIYYYTQNNAEKFSILSSSLLRTAGKYSYGLYVFHFTTMDLLHPYTEKMLWPIFKHRLPETIVLLFAEISIAVIIYHTFEKHFLKLKKYFN
jgi:peptidoglycan/LPS O-acetylase OafA/YrhL